VGEEIMADYLLIGIVIGVVVMGIFSGRAYEKGFKDAKRYVDDE
jgi:hypothetical protein